jgi:predicted permease
MLASLLNDVRYALRGFALRPLFAVVVVLTLAIGIGVNTAMYSIFEQVLLRPLPVHEPHGLVNLSSQNLGRGNVSCNNAGDCSAVFSYPMFRDLERFDGPFTGIAAHRYVDANIAFGPRSEAGFAMLVSGSYFPVLGLAPALGRLLGPGDDAVDGEAAAVVLSHEYWQNALGADPAVIGKTLVVNGKPLTIVGVVPATFHGTTIDQRVQVYVPITLRWSATPGSIPNYDNRAHRWAYMFARLKPGVSLQQASAEINTAYRAILNDVEAPQIKGLSEQDLAAFRAKTLTLAPGARGQTGVGRYAQAPLTVLVLATSIVLLIACVNVANLMLVRGSGRAGEIAVRTSLGASSGRIVGLLIVEVSLLALFAAIASAPLTIAALSGIGALLPSFATTMFEARLDRTALEITAALALVSAVAFGVAPAFKLARANPGQVLRTEGARATGGKAAARFRTALTTAQIGLSMALLVLAGWFAQSLINASRVDLGIRPDSLVAFTIAPERNGYAPERAQALFDQLERELGAVPGVTAVASSVVALLQKNNWNNNVAIEGVETAAGTGALVSINYVSPRFFDTVGIPLLTGRDFAESDASDRPKVAIVNERFLEKFGLDRDVVGRRMSIGLGGPLDMEIVGVVQDAKYSDVKDPAPPQVFGPRLQSFAPSALNFYVRAMAEPLALRKAIEQVLARLDPNLPIMDLRTMHDVVNENLFVDRFMSTLALVLAALATLLASLGLYGVLSYGVAQRTRELGLRLALGAPPERIRSLVLRQVAWMAAIGGGLGLAAALLLGRAARSLLFELSPSDPTVLALAVLALGAVVVAAGYLPARRASRVDPVVALRSE